VYLLGAGATQAEADYLGARPVNLLMRDDDRLGEGLSRRVLKRTGAAWRAFLGEDLGVDIEKLISLLVASGVDRLSELADHMRRYYFEEIRSRLTEAEIIDRPQLAKGLLEMHRDNGFRREVEILSGIITTNHDGLLQIASQEVFGGVQLGFPFASGDFTPASAAAIPPVLQLHGSFTWRFGVPATANRLRKGSKGRSPKSCSGQKALMP
jgi:hypothetical protein